ncbi:hypothetical protein BD779DRAFT_1545098, partial [Infundibulicybe gibba]
MTRDRCLLSRPCEQHIVKSRVGWWCQLRASGGYRHEGWEKLIASGHIILPT